VNARKAQRVARATPTAHSHARLIDAAARQLRGDGWRVEQSRSDPADLWHLVARKAQKLRVVQILPPLTPAPARQAARVLLGENVRLSRELGAMEQWVPHVRPDGRIIFAPYVLNGQHWEPTTPEGVMQSLRLLALAAAA
jgi:hypothetical protein